MNARSIFHVDNKLINVYILVYIKLTKDLVMKVLKTDVLTYFGSVNETSKQLKVSRQAVHRWGKYIPELRAYQFLEIKKTNSMENSHGQAA